MKRTIYLALLMLAIASGIAAAPAWLKTQEKVTMKEILNRPTTKSATTWEPIEVCRNTTNIDIRFNANLGSCNIVVVNQYGFPVCQQSVNATSGSRVTIGTQSWAPGTYNLRILYGQGGGLEGQFVK